MVTCTRTLLAQRTKKRTSFDLIIHQRLKLFWTLFVTVYSTLDFANFRTFANYMCGKSFLYSNFEATMFTDSCHQWREQILNSCCKAKFVKEVAQEVYIVFLQWVTWQQLSLMLLICSRYTQKKADFTLYNLFALQLVVMVRRCELEENEICLRYWNKAIRW